MLQFYLRAAGLSLAWIGSGRFVFAHDLSDDDFAVIASRFVAAASTMEADGLFWCAEGQTGRSVRRRVLRELAHATAREVWGVVQGEAATMPNQPTPRVVAGADEKTTGGSATVAPDGELWSAK
jgi:hypothetical protein